MHSRSFKKFSFLLISSVLTAQSIPIFASNGVIYVDGRRITPEVPDCFASGRCGHDSSGPPRDTPPPDNGGGGDGNSSPAEALLAASMKSIDVRCQAGAPDTTSLAEAPQRLIAAQGAFDAKGLRMGYLWDTVKKKLGMSGSRLTVTYADGGSEVYVVINVTGSVAIAPVLGSLVRGSGQVVPANCNKA